MPFTQAEKEAALLEYNIDPLNFDLQDDGTVVKKVKAQPAFSDEPTTLENATIKPSTAGVFGRSAARSVAPTVAGAGALALANTLIKPLAVTPWGAALNVAVGLGSALVAGGATKAAQDTLAEGSGTMFDPNVESVDVQAHPLAALGGSLATTPLGGFNANFKNVGQAGRTLLGKVAGGVPTSVVTREGALELNALNRLRENANLANVGLGAGLSGATAVGMDVGSDIINDQPIDVDWTNAAIETGVGALFNKPNAIGKKLFRFEDLPDIPEIGLRATDLANFVKPKIEGPQQTPKVEGEQFAIVGSGEKKQGERLFLDESGVPLQTEKDPNNPDNPNSKFSLFKITKVFKKDPKTGIQLFEYRDTTGEFKIGTVKDLQPNETLERVKTKQTDAARVAPTLFEEAAKVNKPATPPKQLTPEEVLKQLELMTQDKKLYQEGSATALTPEETALLEDLRSRNLSPAMNEAVIGKLMEFARQRGVNVKFNKKLANEQGQPVAGVAQIKNEIGNAVDNIVELNPDKMGLDTPYHENFHQFFNYFRKSNSASDKALYNRALKLTSESPEFQSYAKAKGIEVPADEAGRLALAEEFLTQDIGNSTLRRMLNFSTESTAGKQWLADFKRAVKNRFSSDKMSYTDMRDFLTQRFLGDNPYEVQYAKYLKGRPATAELPQTEEQQTEETLVAPEKKPISPVFYQPESTTGESPFKRQRISGGKSPEQIAEEKRAKRQALNEKLYGEGYTPYDSRRNVPMKDREKGRTIEMYTLDTEGNKIPTEEGKIVSRVAGLVHNANVKNKDAVTKAQIENEIILDIYAKGIQNGDLEKTAFSYGKAFVRKQEAEIAKTQQGISIDEPTKLEETEISNDRVIKQAAENKAPVNMELSGYEMAGVLEMLAKRNKSIKDNPRLMEAIEYFEEQGHDLVDGAEELSGYGFNVEEVGNALRDMRKGESKFQPTSNLTSKYDKKYEAFANVRKGVSFHNGDSGNYFVAPNGEVIPVKDHGPFLREYYNVETGTTELYDRAASENWTRMVVRNRDIMVDSPKRPTGKFLRQLEDVAIEHNKESIVWDTPTGRPITLWEKPMAEDDWGYRKYQDKSATRTSFYLIGPEVFDSPQFKRMPDKFGTYNIETVKARLTKLVPPLEMELYNKAGLQEFLTSGRKTKEELVKWMQENGPKVELHSYGMEGKVSEAKREFDEMHHAYESNGIYPAELNGEILFFNFRTGLVDEKYKPSTAAIEAAKRYIKLSKIVDREERQGPRATSAYRGVSAFSADEPMPEWTTSKSGKNVQRVDVVIPSKGEQFEKTTGFGVEDDIEYMTPSERREVLAERKKANILWQPDGLHENLPNTLGWAMIQYKTGAKGEKIAVIAEAQSRWGQWMRENSKTGLGSGNGNNHPLLQDYNRLILKAAIEQARKEGATHIMISDGETAMMTEGHDVAAAQYSTSRQMEGEDYKPKIGQEPGMRLNYDKVLPDIAAKLTGSKGERISLGEHKNAFEETKPNQNMYLRADEIQAGIKPRTNLIFRNPDGTPKTDVSGIMFDISNAPEKFSLAHPKYQSESSTKTQPELFDIEKVKKDSGMAMLKNFESPSVAKLAAKMQFDDDIAAATMSVEDDADRALYQPSSFLAGISAEVDRIRSMEHPDGKVIADAATKFYEQNRFYKGQLLNDVITGLKKHVNFLNPVELFTMDNEQFRNVVNYLYDMHDKGSSTIKLSAEEQNIEKLVRDNLQKSLALKNSFPTLRKTKTANSNYLPHIPSRKALDTLLNKPGSREAQDLIKDWHAYYTGVLGKSMAESQAAYNSFWKSYSKSEATLAKKFGPIDEAAGLGLPRSWRETQLVDIMSRFNNRYARRLAYEAAFNGDKNALAALNNTEGVVNSDIVKRVMDNINGSTEHEEAKRNAISGLVRSGMLGPLTGAKDFVANFTIGWQHMDAGQTVSSVVDALSNLQSNWKSSFEQGINRENIAALEFGEGGIEATVQFMRRSRDILSTVQGRNKLEQFTRAIAMGQGRYLVKDNLVKWKNGSLNSQNERFLNTFMPDYKTSKLTQADLDAAAARYVESVQGTYDYRGLPHMAVEGSWAPILSLARWNIEKMNNFRKHVIAPAGEGDLKPFLMQTIGMVIGGAAVEKLVEEATNRKSKLPSKEELQQLAEEENYKGLSQALTYKMMGLASMAGYGGAITDMARIPIDAWFRNKPQEYNNPTIWAITSMYDHGKDLIEAYQNDDLELRAEQVTQITERILTDYLQTARLVSGMIDKDQIEKNRMGDKLRDLKIWKITHGESVPNSSVERSNPYLDEDIKKFKKETDVEEIKRQLPVLVKRALDNSKGDAEKLRKELMKLKMNSYQTIPSPETMPRSFLNYVEWLKRTQGEDEAAKRLQDYIERNAINRAKSAALP